MCRHDDARRDGTRPHETCACPDDKHAAARYVRRLGAREHHHMVIKVAMQRLVGNLAFSLPWANAIVERLDVRHIALQKLGSWATGFPVGYLDI